MDRYKEMLEEERIYIDNDQQDVWLKKYFPEKWHEKSDRINQAIHNSLYELMKQRNELGNKEVNKTDN